MDDKETKNNMEAGIQSISANEKSDWLKYLATHFSSPRVAIGRKEFFVGGITIWLSVLLLGALIYFLFGDNPQLVFVVTALSYTYLSATWFTKRFLDIRPNINAKSVQIALFFLFITLSILIYIQAGMLTEFRAFSDYVAINGVDAEGAPIISATALTYGAPVSVTRAVLGIPLSIFGLFLLFMKGAKTQVGTSSKVDTAEWNIINTQFMNKDKELNGGNGKKVLVVVIVALLIAGWGYYNKTQNDEVACLQRVKYYVSYYGIDGRDFGKFKTQAEAMNYCMKVLN